MEMLTRCPVCAWAYFYRWKDFNKKWGCALLIAGALLSPWTYGLSLALCALFDAWLYRRLKEATVCYICGTVFRDAPLNPEHKEFAIDAAPPHAPRGVR